MEKAVLNVSKLRITQGMNDTFSHQGTLAIDMAGHGSFRAPFTGTIKRIYASDNEVWLESNNKVLYADGTIDYMTLLIMHDNDISNLKVGKVIKQNEIFYQEGTKGKVTGAHNHVTVGKGKFTGSGWYKNSQGQWCINNQYPINKALFVYKDVKITNGYGYDWKRTNDFTVPDSESTGVITYQAYTNKWLPEVNKCDNTNNGYAGIGKSPITGFRCKPQHGELIYEAHLKGENWLPKVNSKDYSKGGDNSYAGWYGKPIDMIRIKSTKGWVKYRVKTIEDGWLPFVDSKTESGSESYAGIPNHTIIGIQMY